MDDQHDTTGPSTPVKRRYERPTVTVLGTMAELTGGQYSIREI